jgi:hypothetical protein
LENHYWKKNWIDAFALAFFDNDHHVDTPHGDCHVEAFVDMEEQSKNKLTRLQLNKHMGGLNISQMGENMVK